jgi:hypothetical protein
MGADMRGGQAIALNFGTEKSAKRVIANRRHESNTTAVNRTCCNGLIGTFAANINLLTARVNGLPTIWQFINIDRNIYIGRSEYRNRHW